MALVVIEIAAQIRAEVRVVVESFDQIREVASVLEAEKSAAGLSSFRHRIGAGDEMNTRDCVDKEVSWQTFSVVGKTSPAEEPFRAERTLGRAIQECVPVDGLLARVRRNGIDPGPARRIAVPVGLNVTHLTELARIINFLSLGINNGADSLASNLHNPVALLRGFDHGESVFYGVRHWLFAIDVFACSSGIYENFAMLMV